VESVCVAAEPDERGPTRLVAYLVLAGGAAPAKRDLFAFARTRLPAYMVPQRWIAVPRLPLTINGKVDRAELARSATAARTL
jgi:acyl-coenzyme A synthetase/AMP-(fatty) acid ligase